MRACRRAPLSGRKPSRPHHGNHQLPHSPHKAIMMPEAPSSRRAVASQGSLTLKPNHGRKPHPKHECGTIRESFSVQGNVLGINKDKIQSAGLDGSWPGRRGRDNQRRPQKNIPPQRPGFPFGTLHSAMTLSAGQQRHQERGLQQTGHALTWFGSRGEWFHVSPTKDSGISPFAYCGSATLGLMGKSLPFLSPQESGTWMLPSGTHD